MVTVSFGISSSDLVKNQNLRKILVPLSISMFTFGFGLFVISAVAFHMSQKHLDQVSMKLLNYYVEESKVNTFSDEKISMNMNITRDITMDG